MRREKTTYPEQLQAVANVRSVVEPLRDEVMWRELQTGEDGRYHPLPRELQAYVEVIRHTAWLARMACRIYQKKAAEEWEDYDND